MYRTEKIAKKWIEENYTPIVRYSHNEDPDFETSAGRLFEVKSVSSKEGNPKVAFKVNQLRKFKDVVRILVYDRVTEKQVLRFDISNVKEGESE